MRCKRHAISQTKKRKESHDNPAPELVSNSQTNNRYEPSCPTTQVFFFFSFSVFSVVVIQADVSHFLETAVDGRLQIHNELDRLIWTSNPTRILQGPIALIPGLALREITRSFQGLGGRCVRIFHGMEALAVLLGCGRRVSVATVKAFR